MVRSLGSVVSSRSSLDMDRLCSHLPASCRAVGMQTGAVALALHRARCCGAGARADPEGVHKHGLPGDAQQRVRGEQARPIPRRDAETSWHVAAVGFGHGGRLRSMAGSQVGSIQACAQSRLDGSRHGWMRGAAYLCTRARAASGTLTRCSSHSSTRRGTRTTPSSSRVRPAVTPRAISCSTPSTCGAIRDLLQTLAKRVIFDVVRAGPALGPVWARIPNHPAGRMYWVFVREHALAPCT